MVVVANWYNRNHAARFKSMRLGHVVRGGEMADEAQAPGASGELAIRGDEEGS